MSKALPLQDPPFCEAKNYVFLTQDSFSFSFKILTFDVSKRNSMIISFGNSNTEKVWSGIRVKKLPLEIQTIGRRKLRMIHNSVNLADLRIPPSNRLEKLSGKLKDFYSIRINDQWRIILKWNSGNAFEVEIIDYH